MLLKRFKTICPCMDSGVRLRQVPVPMQKNTEAVAGPATPLRRLPEQLPHLTA
jgi:hypothetical protein